MRNLQTADIFAGVRVVTALELKDEIKAIVLKANEAKQDQRSVGYDILYTIIDKASRQKGEIEIYRFLARIFECSVEEVATMDPVELIDKTLECANIEKWKAFFSRVASLMGKN